MTPHRRRPIGVEPVALRALSSWRPRAPRSRPGRLAARVWAAPVTLVGLLVGAGGAVRPRRVAGVLLFAPVRGVTGATLRANGFAAGAFGHVVVAVGDPGPALLDHELAHVRQAEYLGPLFVPAYLGLLAVYGYRRHPLERAARAATTDPTEPGGPGAHVVSPAASRRPARSRCAAAPVRPCPL